MVMCMMAEDDKMRRLSKMRARPTLAVKGDEYLEAVLEDALETFLDLTHRSKDPGERVDSLLIRLAVVYSNQEGVEGNTKAEDGELKREWTDTLPADLYRQIKSWRLVVGVNAVHDA